MARQRLGWQLRAVTAVLALVALVVGGVALYRSDAFAVRRYRLVGARHLTLARVLQLAQVPAGVTLMRFPSAEVRDRVATDPWVATLTVRRLIPDTVEFDVTERVPVALLSAQNTLWLVDADGWVLAKEATTTTAPSMPVLRRMEALKPQVGRSIDSTVVTNALSVLTGMGSQIRRSVRAVDAPSVDETALLTNQNVEILVGPATDLVKKDLLVRKILAAQRGIVFIDVRSTDRPVSRGIGK